MIAPGRFEESPAKQGGSALETAAGKCGAGERLGPGNISQSEELQVRDRSLKGRADSGKHRLIRQYFLIGLLFF